jgi:epoxyqueuosine reductase QueG
LSLEERNYHQLKNLAENWGASLFGVGAVEDLSQRSPHLTPALSEGLGRAVSMGVLLSRRILNDIEDHPTKLYFYHYRRVNNALDQLAVMVANSIQAQGFEALPVPASQTADWEKQTGLISHREMAYEAGLGFRGLNSLLVNPRYGAQVRLVTLLTDMPLKTDEKVEENHCGGCMACPPLCPAGAIGDKPEDFDRWACLEKLKEFSKKHNIGQYICGICVKACSGADR